MKKASKNVGYDDGLYECNDEDRGKNDDERKDGTF